MKRSFTPLFLILFLLICKGSFGQLSVTNCSSLGMTPAQFIQNWLIGSGVTISNAKFNGSSAVITSTQLGSFQATGNALLQMGIDSGMILTSGKADTAVGPNSECGSGLDVDGPGDPDLTIMAGVSTFDKCVLEFDFIPLSDTLRFKYVFGSEELFIWCYQYNDPFGFFLSGPGINGTFSNYSKDIALMPGSNNYVTINNICSDQSSVWCNAPLVCGPDTLCNNSPVNSGLYYQYNAMTYVFTAWHVVQPCLTYHIKIAIADAKDHIWDSGVFLKKGSFSSTSISGNSQVCIDSSGNVYTTQPGMMNYQWTVSAGGQITSGGTSSDNTVTVTWISAGPQTVAVNYSNAGGCSSPFPAVFNVMVIASPVPVITGPSTVCVNSTGNVYNTLQGMNNYSWTVSAGGIITGGGTPANDFVTVTWTNSGIQTVSVNYKDSTGCPCENPGIDSVNVLPLPVPTITGQSSACMHSTNNSYTTEAGMNNYTWTISAGGIITAGPGTDSITVTWNDSGQQSVSVIYISQNGCSPESPSVFNVTITPLPDAAGNITGPSQLCSGTNGLIYSVPPINNASGYFWTLPPGFNVVSGSGTNTIVINVANDADSGTINVYGSNLCGNGLVSPPFQVDVTPPASAYAGPDLVTCPGTPIVISQASAVNFSSILWLSNGTGTLINSMTLTPTYTPGPSETGTIVLTLIAAGIAPCKNDTSRMILNIIKTATVTAGADQVSCENRQVVLSGSGSDYISVQWTTSGNGTFNDPANLNTTYTPGTSDVSSGQVTLTLLAYSYPPCDPDSDSMILTLGETPAATPGPDASICHGMSYTVHGAAIDHSSGFRWEDNGRGELKDTNTLNPTYIPAPDELGEVWLTLIAFGVDGCQDSLAFCNMKIFIYPAPVVNAGEDQSIPYNSSTSLSCEPSGGGGSFQYVWIPGSLLINSTVQNPQTVNLLKDTVFIITVTDNVTGCAGSDSIRVHVGTEEGNENCIVIHNVITPNGDGLNDKWDIECIELFPENKVELFNIWGTLVNEFDNYNNEDIVWKGTNKNGDILPDGTYYYILKIKNIPTFTGWVLLRGGSQ